MYLMNKMFYDLVCYLIKRDVIMKKYIFTPITILSMIFILSCDDDDSADTTGGGDISGGFSCEGAIEVDDSKGVCSATLIEQSQVSFSTSGDFRIIISNNIPNHDVGLFGVGPGSLNPNAITPQNSTYQIDLTPSKASNNTQLLNNGPIYSFGILLNGVELDPVAAEPWPHSELGFNDPNVNWEWNLEATMAGLGVDCNNAHVQPQGKYHYHGTPIAYLNSLNLSSSEMSLIGYAADGYPIYYQPGFESSYKLKSGERPGDGTTAPCGEYTGVYTSDYEYVSGGDLDECNGKEGVTSEFPNGTYYYVVTDTYPGIPRCFVGTPSSDFLINQQ